MPIAEDTGPAAPASGGESEPHRAAQWLGRSSAVLCGLVVIAIVATTISYFNLAEGTADGTAFLITFVVYIPLLSIPVSVVCLTGACLSGAALLTESSRDHRICFCLCLGSPLAVIACYAASYAIMSAFAS